MPMRIRTQTLYVLFVWIAVIWLILYKRDFIRNIHRDPNNNSLCINDVNSTRHRDAFLTVMDMLGKTTDKIILLSSAAVAIYHEPICALDKRLQLGIVIAPSMRRNSYIMELCKHSTVSFELFFVVEDKNYFILDNCINEVRTLDKILNVFNATVHSTYHVLFPARQSTFDNNWLNSKLIQCTGIPMAKKSGHYRLTPSDFTNFRTTYEILQSSGINVFFGDGTLLGWYRDCDVIEHTDDFDLYTVKTDVMNKYGSIDNFIEHIVGVQIRRIIGNLTDPMEITFASPVDLFFLNRDEAGVFNILSVIYEERTLIKFTHHYLSTEVLYTGILREYVFHVPCDAKKVLIETYDEDWYIPVRNKAWHEYSHNKQVVKLLDENEMNLSWHTFGI